MGVRFSHSLTSLLSLKKHFQKEEREALPSLFKHATGEDEVGGGRSVSGAVAGRSAAASELFFHFFLKIFTPKAPSSSPLSYSHTDFWKRLTKKARSSLLWFDTLCIKRKEWRKQYPFWFGEQDNKRKVASSDTENFGSSYFFSPLFWFENVILGTVAAFWSMVLFCDVWFGFVLVVVVRICLRFGTYCGIGGGIRVGFVLFLARKRIVVAISWISFSEK